MRVMHIITGLGTGGAERALYNVLSGGLAAAQESQVVSLSDGGRYADLLRQSGVAVHSLGMRRGIPSPWALLRLRRLVRQMRPDLVQGWMYHGNLAASMAAWLVAHRTPVVWNVRQCLYDIREEKRLTRQVIRLSCRLSGEVDGILYNSHLSRLQHEQYGYADARGQVIPNGFDLDRFGFSATRRTMVRTQLGIPDDVPVVGHVARLHPMKDHPTFLRAAVQLAQRHPTVRFLLVGKGVTIAEPTIAVCLPEEFRYRFVFTGERDDVPDLMSAMDIFCQSSWSEAFPNVLGEAMACGLPCATTDVGDSAQVVANTGLIVPPRSPEKLAAALGQLLSLPTEKRTALGNAARARIERHYSLAAAVRQYADLYQGLLDGAA